MAPGSRFERSGQDGSYEGASHCTVLVRNRTGHANLMQLVSKAYLEGFYYKPRVDRELLAQHADGLLVLSGCLNSEVSRQLSAGEEAKARETAGWYQEVFGKDHYFMEVQSHGLDGAAQGHARARSGSPARSARRSCGTNDSHYLEAERRPRPRGPPVHPDRHDDERPEPLALLHRGVLSEVGRRDARGVQGAAGGVHEHAGGGGAVQRRPRLRAVPPAALPGARRVHARFVPRAPGLRGPDARATDRRRRTRWSSASATSSASSRRWDSPGYFLVVWDFIAHARRQGIAVGPGRGSSAGSLVAYCLGITNVDPIRYGLHLRALPEPRADLDARHGHRLRRRPPRRGDPLRRRALRRRPRRPHHHVRDHGRQGRDPRRGARPRLLLRRGRPHRQARPELPAQHLARRVAREVARARRAGQARSARDASCGAWPRRSRAAPATPPCTPPRS